MSSFLRYVLEAGVCLGLFYAAYWLFLKKETYFHLNRIFLIAALLLSFIIPALNVSSPFLTAPTAEETIPLSQALSIPRQSLDNAEILLVVYAAGALLFFSRFIFHLVNLLVVVRKNGARRCNGIKIVSVDKEFSPFSFFSIIFINDRSFNEASRQNILAHEEIHIRQYHSLDILLIELVTIIQWFNPFVRPYKKALQETHEFLADNGVIAQGFSTAKYQLLMFEQHVGAKLFEFANNFKQSQIKRRITMMSKMKSKSAAKLKLLLVLPIASLLVLALADPKPAKTANHTSDPALQENTAQSQEDSIKKQKIAQAEETLRMLKEKESDLQAKLESTSDPEKKKGLEHALQEIMLKEKEIESFLHQRGGLTSGGENLAETLQMLKDKEMKIREELDKAADPEKKAELHTLLTKVLDKEAKVKAMIAEGKNAEAPTIEELKKAYTQLKQKEEDIRAQLEKTEDPEKKAELKVYLEEVLKKQAMIKAKAEAMQPGKEQNKN